MLSRSLLRHEAISLAALVFVPFVLFCACVPVSKTSAEPDAHNAGICLKLLEDNGWQAVFLPDETKDAVLNNTPSMKQYYLLQSLQGFPTEKYIGREVRVYSFLILNASSHEEEETVLSHCYFCDGNVIAADVCSTASDGRMTGVIQKRGEPDEAR